MKKKIYSLMLLSLSLFIVSPVVATATASPNSHDEVCSYFMQYKKIYCTMKNKMLEAPITKNASMDFLYEMIPHHEAATEMAENILKYTTNPQIESIAKSIIKEQNAGILKMKLLLTDLKNNTNLPSEDDYEYIQTYERIIHTMFTKMAAPPVSCDVDIMFLDEMIPHHEGAIAMAENILKYTTNPILQSIAEQIIATQKPQAIELADLLDLLTQK